MAKGILCSRLCHRSLEINAEKVVKVPEMIHIVKAKDIQPWVETRNHFSDLINAKTVLFEQADSFQDNLKQTDIYSSCKIVSSEYSYSKVLIPATAFKKKLFTLLGTSWVGIINSQWPLPLRPALHLTIFIKKRKKNNEDLLLDNKIRNC